MMDCNRCKIASSCPKNGTSPTIFNNKKLFCNLVGGYGRIPIEESKLSEQSKELVKIYGPCLTIAEIPIMDQELGIIRTEIIKIFHQAVKHERETVSFQAGMLYPESHKP